MAELKIKIKGRRDFNLTREFNSLSTFQLYKDDVGFNDTSNDFSTWCLNSGCGNATLDKIKILTLPSKGRLFLNIGTVSVPNYIDVVVGTEILVSDLVYNKLLKFNAEGSYDNQYSDNYTTSFRIERLCGTTGTNESIFVNLNMLDLKNANSNLLVTNIRFAPTHNSYESILYDLVITGEPWIGNTIASITKGANCKLANLFPNPYGTVFQATNDTPMHVPKIRIQPITIPVGTYLDCTLSLSAVNIIPNKGQYCEAFLAFSKTNTPEDTNIVNIYIESEDDTFPE